MSTPSPPSSPRSTSSSSSRPELPPRCIASIPRKQRTCSMRSVPPSRFCPAHDPNYLGSRCSFCNTPIAPDRSRYHVRVCPVAVRARSESERPAPVPLINAPRRAAGLPSPPKPAASEEGAMAAASTARRIYAEKAVGVVKPLDMSGVLEEVEPIREDWANPRNSVVRYEPTHFNQNASLVKLLLKSAALDGPRADAGIVPRVVELGAGRGYTLLLVASVLRAKGYATIATAVDRRRPRDAADKVMRRLSSAEAPVPRLEFSRVRADLADVDLGALPIVVEAPQDAPLLFIGKHVCGDALDMCLLALARLAKEREKEGGKIVAVLASCCRHRCSWDAAAGFDVWREWGADGANFAEVCRAACWALDLSSSDENRRATGRMALELVDVARVKWLRAQGWEAHVERYCEETLSPENHAIVARWDGGLAH